MLNFLKRKKKDEFSDLGNDLGLPEKDFASDTLPPLPETQKTDFSDRSLESDADFGVKDSFSRHLESPAQQSQQQYSSQELLSAKIDTLKAKIEVIEHKLDLIISKFDRMY